MLAKPGFFSKMMCVCVLFSSSFSAAAVKMRFFLILTARLQGDVTLNSLTGKFGCRRKK